MATVRVPVKISLGGSIGKSIRAYVGVSVEPSVGESINLNCIMYGVILNSWCVGLVKNDLLIHNNCCLICN